MMIESCLNSSVEKILREKASVACNAVYFSLIKACHIVFIFHMEHPPEELFLRSSSTSGPATIRRTPEELSLGSSPEEHPPVTKHCCLHHLRNSVRNPLYTFCHSAYFNLFLSRNTRLGKKYTRDFLLNFFNNGRLLRI